MIKKMKYTRHGIALALVGIAAMSAVGSATKDAAAAVTSFQTPTCSVEYVQYAADTLQISCSGVAYTAYSTSWTACTSKQSFETLRHFETIATSAFLSGKKLLINFNKETTTGCGGVANNPAITLLRMKD